MRKRDGFLPNQTRTLWIKKEGQRKIDRDLKLSTPAVGREGFETPKASGRQIYSLLRLTASLPAHEYRNLPALLVVALGQRKRLNGASWRRDLNPQPADYKSAALPLSYASDCAKLQIYNNSPQSQTKTV